jgi:hypothetical protein
LNTLAYEKKISGWIQHFFPQKCLNGFSKNFILLLFVY